MCVRPHYNCTAVCLRACCCLTHDAFAVVQGPEVDILFWQARKRWRLIICTAINAYSYCRLSLCSLSFSKALASCVLLDTLSSCWTTYMASA